MGIFSERARWRAGGHRVRKESFVNGTLASTDHYVRDASGNTLAIYNNSTLTEMPIYGASRLGVHYKTGNKDVYQLTDHLGNVRAVIAKTGNDAAISSSTDYYPFGMPMPGRQTIGDELYRYVYQGQEKDPETGKEAFQLRLWDSRIGRWLSTDPYGQYNSPYLGMGNDPINGIDPDGGHRNWWQAFRAWVGGGLKGKIFKSDNPGTPWHKYGIDKSSEDGLHVDFGLSNYTSEIANSDYKWDDNGVAYFQPSIRQFEPNLALRVKETGIIGTFAYDFANGFYTTGQMFLGRSVGDYSMRNLDGTATTTDDGVMGFVGTATFGYGKYASSLKYIKEPIKSTPSLWNIFQRNTKGIYGSRRAAADAYKIKIKSINNMIDNHNGLVKALDQSDKAIGITDNTSSIIDYFINKN